MFAFDLITSGSREDIDYYMDLLHYEYITFCEEVVICYEDECRRKNNLTEGSVSFDSHCLDDQRKADYIPYSRTMKSVREITREETPPREVMETKSARLE